MNIKLYNRAFTLLSFGMIGVVVAIQQAENLTQEEDIARSMMIIQSSLEEVFNTTKTTQHFSSYLSEDLESAKAWFLKPENHPNDGKEKDQHYMKERLTLALIYSANCKEDCKLKDANSSWLSSSDHCKWEGVTCKSTNEIIELTLGEKGLSQSFILFELDQLKFLNLTVNNLSGKFTVAGGNPFAMRKLRKLDASSNKLTGVKRLLLLKKVRILQFRNNTMGDKFVITTNNFPTKVQRLEDNHRSTVPPIPSFQESSESRKIISHPA